MKGMGRHVRLLRERIARRNGVVTEAAAVIALYAAYQISRGFADDSATRSLANAHEVVALERRLQLFHEGALQDAVMRLPGMIDALGLAYMSLHLAGTVALLTWVYVRRPGWFPLLRTALAFASAIALTIYYVYPTAPPRLADIGIVDTVTTINDIDLRSRLLGRFYNPFAAVPSMHFGYALLIGLAIAALARRRAVRVAALAYPAVVLVVIVATGNHFILDAAAGAAVSLVGLAAAWLVCSGATPDLILGAHDVRQTPVVVAFRGRPREPSRGGPAELPSVRCAIAPRARDGNPRALKQARIGLRRRPAQKGPAHRA
jgi:PAP2 superfamily